MLKRYPITIKISIVFIIFSILTSCAFLKSSDQERVYIKNEKKYGVIEGNFRGRWWNHYERGVSFSKGGFWKEAERDFRRAIKKNFEDERLAITYGIHFIDYFAHRELGVVLYNLSSFEEAENELLLSISHEKNAKAKFYLNKTRKKIIEKNSSDLSEPLLQIDFPPNNLITGNIHVEVNGIAKDDQYISEIKINGELQFIEQAEKEIPFSKKIKLKPGKNQIIITATDLAGKLVYKEISINVDRFGPLVTIESISKTGNGKYIVKGFVYDEMGIDRIIFNKKLIKVKNKKEYFFSETIKESSSLSFKAIDRVGNVTEGKIDLTSRSAKNSMIRLVYNDVNGDDPFLYNVLSSTTPNLKDPLPKTDTTPPVIILKKRIQKEQTTFQNTFFIEGRVVDTGKIKTISINNVPISWKPGIEIYFNYVEALEVGKNKFVITAEDLNGNLSKKVIQVKKILPLVNQRKYRLTAAILPFSRKGRENLTSKFENKFNSSILKKKRFNFVSRETKAYQAALQEIHLSAAGLLKENSVIRIGKMSGAELIFHINVQIDKNSIHGYGSVIDSETSEQIVNEDVYGENLSFTSLTYIAEGLIFKILKHFPMINGWVVEVKDKEVFINAGRDKKVTSNMRFILYRKDKNKNKIKNKKIEVIQELKVAEVYDNLSRTEVIKNFKNTPVKLKDQVITK